MLTWRIRWKMHQLLIKPAQLEDQQNQKTQANVLAQTRGIAGGSGIASLTQSIINQGQVGAQRASAGIEEQEIANQKAAAQQASQLQQMERQGAWKADMTRRAGEEASRTQTKDKVSTLLGMATGRLGTAKQADITAKKEMYEGIGSAFTLGDVI